MIRVVELNETLSRPILDEIYYDFIDVKMLKIY